MGCGNGNQKIPLKINQKKKLYEDYEEINSYTFDICFYILIWKKRPDTCYFQKISGEVIKKSEITSLNKVLEKMTLENVEDIKSLIKQDQILFYVFCSNGVIITKNSNKINFYLSSYIDNIINLSFVDISVTILPEREYYSLYELKRQSKYFYNLNMKEVDFSERNKLTNDGKMEQLSDFDDIEEEVEKEEKNNEKYKDIDIKFNINHFNGEYMKNEDDNFLGINDNKKKEENTNSNILLDVNSILNKETNNKILKEIKEYANKEVIEKKETRKSMKKDVNSSMITNATKSKIDKSKDKKEEKNREKSKDNIKDKSKDKIRDKIRDKSNDKKSNSKNKELKNSKSEIKLKSDKILFKNKKELNKKKDINGLIYPFNKRKSNNLNGSNFEEKDEKINNHIKDTINLNNQSESSKKNSLILNKEENKENKPSIPPPYEIKDNCLIISTNKLTKEINAEFQKILFTEENESQNNEDDENENENKDEESPKKKKYLFYESAYDHVNYFCEEKKKKRKANKSQSLLQHIKNDNSKKLSIKEYSDKDDKKNLYNDYIIIYNKYKEPFDKKKSSHKINKIYFRNCKFSIESIYYLKEFISMLVKYEDLKKIYFSNNDIDMNFIGWKFLKQLFRENFNIRWVSFKNSNLNDNVFEILISALLLKRIRYLNLSNNNITNKSMYLLNKFLIKNQTLSILDMSHNQYVDTDGIKLILNALKLHPNICKLDFSYMNIPGSGELISSLLSENKSIITLILKNDNFNDIDMKSISKELSKRESTLEHLDLSENTKIGDDGLKEIGKIIYNNKSLKSIGLDGMNLSMINYLPIFKGIFKNRTIENYSLNKNEGLPLKGILNFFQKNPQVKKISIIPWDRSKDEENEFSEEQIYLLEKFHIKAPHVTLQGINIIDN